MNLIFTNSQGRSIDFCSTAGMTLYNADGFQPTELDASMVRKAYANGAVVNSSHRGERQVILNLALTAGRGNDAIRRNLYEILGEKDAGLLRLVDGDLDVSAEAYAQAPAADTWTLTPTIQVSFLCPSAFFRATEQTTRESATANTFTIVNKGQTSTGVRIEATFSASVNGLVVENQTNGDIIHVDYSFKAGDILTLTTEVGEKGAILYRGGAYYDIFGSVTYGERWLRVERGSNSMLFTNGKDVADSGIALAMKFNALYWGI